jgi:hypothetical protein
MRYLDVFFFVVTSSGNSSVSLLSECQNNWPDSRHSTASCSPGWPKLTNSNAFSNSSQLTGIRPFLLIFAASIEVFDQCLASR